MAIKQKVYKTTFKLRRGQSTEWSNVNPVLADGEPGFELDTFKLKIGDGDTPWDELPYVAQPQGEIINSNVVFVNEEPLNPVENTLYIFINTKEIKVYANGEWLILNAGSSADLTNYVTRDELFEELEKLEIPQDYVKEEDLKDFVKTSEVEEMIREAVEAIEIPETSNFATKQDLVGLATEDFVNTKISELNIPTDVVTNEEFNSFKNEVENNYKTLFEQTTDNYNALSETVNNINENYLTKTAAQQTFVSNQTLESKNYVTEQELADKEYVPVTEVETIVKNEVETQIKELVTNPDLDYGEV